MKIVGIAGESGTGKSVIAAHLAKRGVGHIDADRVAHDILNTDKDVRRAVVAEFGKSIVTDGGIDRKKLADVVFADDEAVRKLNSIVHPVVIERIAARIDDFRARGIGLLVIDAALLLEVPLPFDIDLMIALTCGREEQMRRLVSKGGHSSEELAARLNRQTHLKNSFYRADVVIDTERPKKAVLEEIDSLVDGLLKGT